MNMALHCINLPFKMPLLCIMAGFRFALPTHCACGTSFAVEHALSCPKGGLPSIWYNKIRDLTATSLTEVCSQVATEPELQPVSQVNFSLSTANVQGGARLDIVMNGFWGWGQNVNLLMSLFLIHLLHQMQPVLHQLAIRSMKTQRREHIVKGFEK